MDGVAVELTKGKPPVVRSEAFVDFSEGLRDALFDLQQPGDNEIEREALAANALAVRYAVCCHELLRAGNLSADEVRAVGVHGQTVRHRPEKGYTRKSTTRRCSRRCATSMSSRTSALATSPRGGQGAPLVPAFHATMFASKGETRVVCNLGGISNITILAATGAVHGFDCGPANALLDEWAQRHLGKPYDENGHFAAGGQVHRPLLHALLDEPFFELQPPKSTGRDLFNAQWLDAKLQTISIDEPSGRAGDARRTDGAHHRA